MWSAAERRIAWPVTVEPVNVSFGTCGWATRAAPVVGPSPWTTLKTPAGIPASSVRRPELRGRERRLLGHLEHDRVADRQRRRGLPAGEQERVVPRADRTDDAVRLADGVDEVAGVGRVRGAVRQLGVAGEVGQEVGAEVDLGDGLPERLARVARLDRADPVGVLVDELGQPAHDRRAVARARPSTRRPIRRRRVRRRPLGRRPRPRRRRPGRSPRPVDGSIDGEGPSGGRSRPPRRR